MKIGDLVQLIGEFPDGGRIAMIIAFSSCPHVELRVHPGPGWCLVLAGNRTWLWPESQMEPLGQNDLTDQQLEKVRGGMSAERFDIWRVEKINEV